MSNEHVHSDQINRPKYELSEIFKRYWKDFIRNHGYSYHQEKVIRAIMSCRTSRLGGHITECSNGACDYEIQSYNSCNNRHCSKCQGGNRIKWVYQRILELLPLPYYHVVFTLPHLLNDLSLCNKAVIYDLFFKSASMTLHDFSQDQKYLGAQLGFMGILHTWSQTLAYHVHLHFILAGGGLSFDSESFKRLPYKEKFLFPVRAMSKRMRKHFTDLLYEAYSQKKLRFPGKLQNLREAQYFDLFLDCVGDEEWVIYSKKPFSGPEQVVEYIGRYTHRVAISNYRLTSIEDGEVCFRYRDNQDKTKDGKPKVKEMCLSAEEFIRRFLLHILPSNFRKIRYYGILSLGQRKGKYQLARKFLGEITAKTIESLSFIKDWIARFESLLFGVCPQCKNGTLIYNRVSFIDSS